MMEVGDRFGATSATSGEVHRWQFSADKRTFARPIRTAEVAPIAKAGTAGDRTPEGLLRPVIALN
jgi:hypothetical protein